MELPPNHESSDGPLKIDNLHFAVCNLQSSWISPPRIDSVELISPAEGREVNVQMNPPWVRSLGKLSMRVSTEGWRFPIPIDPDAVPAQPKPHRIPSAKFRKSSCPYRRLQPSADTVLLKERLLYLLQPPLENLLAGRQVRLYAQPYPYQLEGIAFLMPRQSALLADEMGLGKTMQAILALRLLFHAGLIQRVLIVCPKSLVSNWARELRQWAEDLPYEV